MASLSVADSTTTESCGGDVNVGGGVAPSGDGLTPLHYDMSDGLLAQVRKSAAGISMP